ncbi:hypothetical protein [Mucisphaera calidilacus]|uniref:Uncharacterized protein n=1 Tax=Mucisphaera calidilacus TaxID=2527982 RepID=A0A518BXA8_9BACT|nr:hypothetical protein [Mucisphaera calidilacus]QDU71607.1 hypothetical protein Pan265_14590 [Mucisphaera calidilacus]
MANNAQPTSTAFCIVAGAVSGLLMAVVVMGIPRLLSIDIPVRAEQVVACVIATVTATWVATRLAKRG